MDPGFTINWFGGYFDLVPNLFNNIGAETIGNFLMFLPFGVLYPLSQTDATWKRSVTVGLATVVVIEVFQPVFGRSFDMNDIILDSLGIVVSVSVLVGVKRMLKIAK